MGIKKNNATTNKATTNKATTNVFYDVATAISNSRELENGNGMQFSLNKEDTARLTIMETANGIICFLSLFNVSIFGNVRKYNRNGVEEWFVSFPSFKKQNGEYFNYVTSYNKELNALIKGIVNEYCS